jgi:hypothetical protein
MDTSPANQHHLNFAHRPVRDRTVEIKCDDSHAKNVVLATDKGQPLTECDCVLTMSLAPGTQLMAGHCMRHCSAFQ